MEKLYKIKKNGKVVHKTKKEIKAAIAEFFAGEGDTPDEQILEITAEIYAYLVDDDIPPERAPFLKPDLKTVNISGGNKGR